MDAPELGQIRDAIMSGTVNTTDVDHMRGVCSAAIRMCKRLGLPYKTIGGGTPGPYTNPTAAGPIVLEQLGARWPVSADQVARNIAECIAQTYECVGVVNALPAPVPPRPAPTPVSGWSTLPVMTSAAVTSANDSHQSAVPSWQADGMHVALPASGGSPGPGASAPSGSYQRCENYVAGASWQNLTGTLFLRYDFTLLAGFPTNTNTWQTIAQCKNSSTGSPPLELMVGNKAGATNAIYVQWHSASGAETGTEVLGVATTGVQHSVVLSVQFSTSSATVTGWLDGVQAFSNASHGPTLYAGQSSYAKIGIYRDAAVGVAAEVVFRAVAIGSTFASVTT